MDGGWLLSIYRATAKDAAKLTSEMASWKNIRDDEKWQKKKSEIEEQTEGAKQPTRCRRQRHIDAVRNKRKGRYENGKRRADVAIDIIVKDVVAIMGCAGATRVCVGHNIDQKKKSKLKHGSIASQAFQAINYTRIRSRIEHWCGIFGWEYVEVEESYTSKVSSYDMEELPSWDGEVHPEREYVGKRFRRGLFRSADGTVINADVNGALNIWRKGSLNGRLDRAERLAGVYHPYRVSAEVRQAA
jgi:IS605 OrfB family transposase